MQETAKPSSDKDWKLIEKLVNDCSRWSNARARRWGIFFKLVFSYLYLFPVFIFLVIFILSSRGGSDSRVGLSGQKSYCFN